MEINFNRSSSRTILPLFCGWKHKLRLFFCTRTTDFQSQYIRSLEEAIKLDNGIFLLLYGCAMFRFQLSLDQMRMVADEGVRLANLCSTRMGRAQQMCKERADAVMAIDSFLRNTADMDRKIKDLNKQVDKLVRFCNQTEQAMTHLEALATVVRTEEEASLNFLL
ncbi:unnamed protein product [Haemonchus placei]|uniref:BLOC-1-related complex subunit 7 n=1 Tax=Haemonchus placei TaxID=6290 RepID=A0A0N4W4L4_HAEPC|nr:unnamed protein product [Haemonchus placei]